MRNAIQVNLWRWCTVPLLSFYPKYLADSTQTFTIINQSTVLLVHKSRSMGEFIYIYIYIYNLKYAKLVSYAKGSNNPEVVIRGNEK